VALFYVLDNHAGRYFVSNYIAAAMFVALCLWYIVRDIRDLPRGVGLRAKIAAFLAPPP
jgi:hypothetical protein